MWEEYQRGHIQEQQQWAIIEQQDEPLKRAANRIGQLEKQVAQLQAKLPAWHRRQFKASKARSSSESQPSDTAHGTNKPPAKRGAPVGHPGWQRAGPDHVDHQVAVPAPKRCPHCGARDLEKLSGNQQHLQEDIVLVPRTVVTCFEHQQARCARCKRTVIQAAAGELLGAPIGPVAKSTAISLRYRRGFTLSENPITV